MEVVAFRAAEGVFVAVVATGDDDVVVEDGAGEERAYGGHVGAAAPCPRGETEDVDRPQLRHGGWVPPAEHHEVAAHGGEAGEERQAAGVVEASDRR